MISEPHGYGGRMSDHLSYLIKVLIDTCPVRDSHTEKMMMNQIIQPWQFQVLKLKRCANHTSPQEVIIVEINKDLLTPADWVEHSLSIK